MNRQSPPSLPSPPKDAGLGMTASRGRVFSEPRSARTEFQRDRDRIIHSSAFRRLASKTQVFLPDEGDHYRTRLTHTIEVAQIARSIARALRLDEDLTEALALAHDLGHAPFGHTGEDALDAVIRPIGGFDHNGQTLRIVTRLERRYPDFDGLNLTIETLDGLVKRKWVWPGEDDGPKRPLPAGVDEVVEQAGLDLAVPASHEAEAATVADDIAYNAHDLEDGLDAGLFDLGDLDAVPVLADLMRERTARHPKLDRDLTIRALIRDMIGRFVDDVIAEGRRTVGRGLDLADRRPRQQPLVRLSPATREESSTIKRFLRERMYRHPRLLKVRACAFDIVTDLATHLIAAPGDLPPAPDTVAARLSGAPETMRAVADYIAGLTDRSAVTEHRRLFATTPDLR